jgi:hypothetical protein
MEYIILPRLQVHVQAGIPYLVPASVIGFSGQHIVEVPRFSSQLVPGYLDARLGGSVREIHDDDVTLLVLNPTPGKNVPKALVIGPAAPLTEAPFTISKDITSGLFQQASVESHKLLINPL